jgi:L-arabinonolactonase
MTIECVADVRANTGECPVWDALEQILWWTDIPGCRLYRFDPATRENRGFDLPSPCGSFALREGGGLLLALKTGLFAFDPGSLELTFLKPPPFAHPDDRFNDGRTDPAGRFWVCSMRDPPDPDAKAGIFYRIEPDLTLHEQIPGLIIGNGLAFSPDGRTLYMSETDRSAPLVWAWDYNVADGSIRNRRVFADLSGVGGRPDGAAVDAEGCYWTAANTGGQLIRYTPDGRIERQVPLPVQRPTMLAFGGPGLDVIYVTTQSPRGKETWEGQPHAGGLFSLTLGIRGRQEPRFAG